LRAYNLKVLKLYVNYWWYKYKVWEGIMIMRSDEDIIIAAYL
jgi:hypothetical protein